MEGSFPCILEKQWDIFQTLWWFPLHLVRCLNVKILPLSLNLSFSPFSPPLGQPISHLPEVETKMEAVRLLDYGAVLPEPAMFCVNRQCHLISKSGKLSWYVVGFPTPNQQLHHSSVPDLTALHPSRMGRRFLLCYNIQVSTFTVDGIVMERILIPVEPSCALSWEQFRNQWFPIPDLYTCPVFLHSLQVMLQ